YFVSQPLQAGDVIVTFIAGSWSWIDTPLSGGATTTVVTLGTIVDGDASFVVHLGAIAIIIPFPSVPAGFQLVATSLSDNNEFTLDGPGLGTVVIDPSIAPVLVDATHVRYAITGAFANAGAV